jgi:hypothetical protein
MASCGGLPVRLVADFQSAAAYQAAPQAELILEIWTCEMQSL